MVGISEINRKDTIPNSTKTFEVTDVPDYTCVANPNSTAKDLCGATSWACYEQKNANMGGVCDDDWKRCCQRYSCSHQETVDQCTRVFSQYDSQVKSQLNSSSSKPNSAP